jgi:hypothetical protein
LQLDIVSDVHRRRGTGADGRDEPVTASEDPSDLVVSERSHRNDATAG